MRLSFIIGFVLILITTSTSQQYQIVDTLVTFSSPKAVTGTDGVERTYLFKFPGLPRIWDSENVDFSNGTIYTVAEVVDKPDESFKSAIRLAVFSYPNALEELEYPSASAVKHGIFKGACKDGCKQAVFVLDRHQDATKYSFETPPLVFDKLCTHQSFASVNTMKGINEFIASGSFSNRLGSIMVLVTSEDGTYFENELGLTPTTTLSSSDANKLFPLRIRIVSYLVAKGKRFVPPEDWPNIPCNEESDPCKE